LIGLLQPGPRRPFLYRIYLLLRVPIHPDSVANRRKNSMTTETTLFARLTTATSLVALLAAGPALAEHHEVVGGDVEAAGSRVSGVLGADLYSHFVSYGFDVWAEGRPFSGAETFNPYFELAFDLSQSDDDDLSLALGLWGDVNDNADSPLGGNVQEIDVYAGLSKTFGGVSVGVVYQEWFFASQTEKILDINLGFDDSSLWGDSGFSLSPSVTIHNRLDNGLGLSNGTVVVLGAEVPVDLGEDSAISLGVPLAVGFAFDEGYFTAGGDDGFGYFSVGAAASMPLSGISPAYGDWSLNAGASLFVTEDSVYNNPDDSFVVLNIGVSVAF